MSSSLYTVAYEVNKENRVVRFIRKDEANEFYDKLVRYGMPAQLYQGYQLLKGNASTQ